MCWTRIDGAPAPDSRAAVTKSRSRNDSVSARMMRAFLGTIATATAIMALTKDGPRIATMISARRMNGKREEDVHHAHEQTVEPTADVAGYKSDSRADGHAGDRRDDPARTETGMPVSRRVSRSRP